MSKRLRSMLMAALAAACSGPVARARPQCLQEVPIAVICFEEATGTATGTAFRAGPGVWVTARHGVPANPRSCLVNGTRREVHALAVGVGKGGDWCVLKLQRPELDPFTASASFDTPVGDDLEVWAVGYIEENRRDVVRSVCGRISDSVDGPEDMRKRMFIGLEADQDVSTPGMSGAPVIALDDSGGPSVVGIWMGWRERRTTWAGLIRTTSVAGLVVVDPELPIAVDRMLRQQP
ncbi:MAG: trypsin-like peptidase domain-containing protein [Phycisphaerales bacterium]|nr:trypsin-like peptidase domain-containing protein [Phycisphaerales bacterium]